MRALYRKTKTLLFVGFAAVVVVGEIVLALSTVALFLAFAVLMNVAFGGGYGP